MSLFVVVCGELLSWFVVFVVMSYCRCLCSPESGLRNHYLTSITNAEQNARDSALIMAPLVDARRLLADILSVGRCKLDPTQLQKSTEFQTLSVKRMTVL